MAFTICISVREHTPQGNKTVASDTVYRVNGPNQKALLAEVLAIAQALGGHTDDEVKYYAERDREES